MRVLVITASGITGASFRYRVHQFIPFLKESGVQCTVLNAREARIGQLREYDVVLIQKRLFPVRWVSAASRAARRLVFDFDDAIWTCPKMDWSFITRVRVRARLRAMLSRANCVTAGNAYLADYAGRHAPDVHIVPTCVDTARCRPADRVHTRDTLRLGWLGSRPNLIYLERMEPVFRRLSHLPLSLVVVCDREYRSPNLPTEFVPWTLDGELEALLSFDIGIMPLTDDEWTRGKCGFKTIQYMSCGIPSVSSPTGVNAEIVSDGVNGFLAASEDAWVDRLSQLAADPRLRSRLGAEGRRTVEERYSIEVGAGMLLEALTGGE